MPFHRQAIKRHLLVSVFQVGSVPSHFTDPALGENVMSRAVAPCRTRIVPAQGPVGTVSVNVTSPEADDSTSPWWFLAPRLMVAVVPAGVCTVSEGPK